MTDVAAAWATVHGLADLLQTGRVGFLPPSPRPSATAVLTTIIRRALPSAPLTGTAATPAATFAPH